ncbi:MAG: paraslipin [Spirochaetia bacterium]|jgi:regulator of protease activity HflC (stomatin/prohibitin superfamily)|nr:paraslipin [Spirochaetia bacterium]
MSPFLPLYILAAIFGLIVAISILRSIRVVSARAAFVVERLGKYSRTLNAGLHVLIPFIEKIRYKLNLKEIAIDVPAQDCYTLDNVKVRVDGVLYIQVVDPVKASYGISDYQYATIQLAQTTMRSVIGKLELDKTFEERDQINGTVVQSVDEASDPWGVKVSRYEIQNINVPPAILEAMEVQMKAERERRASIARSLGEMESRINRSQAFMEEVVNISEGEKERMVNVAEGRAQEIRSIAKATAASIRKIAGALEDVGGEEAAVLRVSESYIEQLNNIAGDNSKVILPVDLTNMTKVLENVKNMIK